MLLAIDCGNTNALFAMYTMAKSVVQCSGVLRPMTSRTADEYAVWLLSSYADAHGSNWD